MSNEYEMRAAQAKAVAAAMTDPGAKEELLAVADLWDRLAKNAGDRAAKSLAENKFRFKSGSVPPPAAQDLGKRRETLPVEEA